MRTTAKTLQGFITLYMSICFFASTALANSTPNHSSLLEEDPTGNVSISMVTVGNFPDYGVSIPFNITVANQGANDIYDVEVTNTVPVGYTFDPTGTNWLPTALPNVYTNTISGPIGPSGTSLITINLVPIASADSVDWINVAEVTEFRDAPGGTICADSDPTDNIAETAVRLFDLALRKELVTTGDLCYGQLLTFRTYVQNQGNTPATSIQITDFIPEGYTYDPAVNAPNGWSNTLNPMVTLPGQLNSGEETFIDIQLMLTMEMFDEMAWNNYTTLSAANDDTGAERGSFDADSQIGTNSATENSVLPGSIDDNNMNGGGPNAGEDEDDHDPAAPIIYDLALEKIQLTALPSFSYGEVVTFRNRVYNQGNQPLTNIEIVDYIPCGLVFDAANNPGWSYSTATRIAHYTMPSQLDPATVDFVDIVLTVVQCYDDQPTAWSNFAEIARAENLSGVLIDDIDSVMDSIATNDIGAIDDTPTDNQLDGGGPKANEDEDDHDIKMIEVVDLALKKRIFEPGPFNFGDTITFVNTVFNQGNIVLDSIRLRDYLPNGFTFPADINPTWSVNVAGNPEGLLPNMLLPGDSVNYELDLILIPADDETDFYNFSEIILVQDTTNSFTRNRFDDADSFVGTHFFPGSTEPNVIPGSADDNNIFGDGFAGEDSDDNDVAAPIFYDLALTKSLVDPDATIAYGMPLEFVITVTNEGTQLADGVTVTDYLPCGLSIDLSENMGWALDPVSGNATYLIPNPITPGASVDITINLTLEECENSDAMSFTNEAEISLDDGDDRDSTPDDIPGDDPDEDDIDTAQIPVYDLSLSKTISSAAMSYSMGDPITFTIEVTNEGGDTVQNVKVVDYLPCGYNFDLGNNTGWSLNGTTGFLEFNNNTILAPGETFSTDLNLTLQPCDMAADNNYLNGAEISQAEDTNGDLVGDTDSTPDEIQGNEIEDEDDYDEIGVDIYDLMLEKTLTNPISDFAYGQIISYDITVTNEGTMIASGIEVTDYIPCGLAYDGANNSLPWNIDPLTGYAKLVIDNDIAPGSSETVTISLTLEECTDVDAQKFNNKAEISVDDGDDDDSDPDDDPENDPPGEDDNDDEPLPVFDLSLAKSVATPGSYSYNDPISFNITIVNEGSEPLQNIKVVDYLPCGYGFTPNNGWTLNTTSGLIEYTYTNLLDLGESVTLPLELTVQECDQGGADNYLNGAEISEMEDIDNNIVEDIDSTPDEIQGNEDPNEDDYDEAGIDIYDLSLTKTRTNANDPLAYGASISYDIVVVNEGSLPATGVVVTDYIPCGLAYDIANDDDGWSLDPVTGFANYTFAQTILPGEEGVIGITLTVEPCTTPTTDAFTNVAEISDDDGDDDDSDPDDDPENDPPGEDDNDDEPQSIFDLSLTKTVVGNASALSVGDIVTFEIVVSNEGNRDVQNINVIDYVPCGLSTAGQTNAGWNEIVGSNNIESNIELLSPGQSETLEVSFLIVTCATNDPLNYNNEAETTSFEDENGDPADDIDSTPDDIPGDPEEEDDNDTELLLLSGNLGGDVWKDLDNDGIHDTNEPSISGMTVNLFDCDGNFITSTNTGQTGFYIFVDLPANDYQVQFDLSSLNEPCIFTEPNVGGNDAIDSDADDQGFSPCTTVSVGSENYTVDAGLIEAVGSIGDYVFTDFDGDGIQDFGDTGIGGVTVYLYTEGGLVIDSTITEPNGSYSFDEVSSGSYYLEFDISDEYTPTVADATSDNLDSDITEDNGANTTDIFFLAPGEMNNDVDGGFYECATICGYTWLDLVLENDLRDPTENGINGMKVTLFRIQNGITTEYADMYTGLNPATPSDDGYFNFCVPPGRYFLEFTLPPLGLVQVLPLSGPQDINSDVNNVNGPGTTSAFNITNGGEKCDIGAGYTLMSEVGNTVWFDANLNGQRDEFEDPVANVIVQAFDLNNDLVVETITDENGLYNIDYLQKKDYYLKFIPDNGLAFTQPLVGGDELDSDVDHSYGPNTTRAFQSAPGSQNKNMDAGLVQGVLPVEWGSVRAENRGELNLITWSTFTEVNNEMFIVQKASDANGVFENIAEVIPESAFSSTVQSYNFEDRDLFWNDYYYRVVQVDINGLQSVSDIVYVQLDKDGFLLYPNPTNRELRISSAALANLEMVNVKIYNQAGKLAHTANIKLNGSAEFAISVDHLPTGIYSIDVIDNGALLFNQRFIRK